jgi:hypothetical protein
VLIPKLREFNGTGAKGWANFYLQFANLEEQELIFVN